VPIASVSAPTPTAGGPGDVPSPLSGRVTAVIVQIDQQVKEGDHLLTLEAMKMNTFVFAPRSGKVTAIKTEVGGVVNEGQVLVTIG
jgi:biotin carboxyl carrier protein